MEEEQDQPEVMQELLLKLMNDLQILKGIQQEKKETGKLKELSEYINCPVESPTFYDNDDDEYTIIYSKPKAITPDLPIEEPDNSLSMGDEHLDTTSSNENLVPIPSEFKGISEDMCDVPVCEDPSTFDALNDHSEILSDSNNDDTSSNNNDFEDIEYVSLEEYNSLPEFETFSDIRKRRGSGSTTIMLITICSSEYGIRSFLENPIWEDCPDFEDSWYGYQEKDKNKDKTDKDETPGNGRAMRIRVFNGIQQEEKDTGDNQRLYSYWNFSMIDNEEARDNFMKDVCTFLRKFSRIPFGVTPKHLDTIPSVENLVPIPSEFKGISEDMCDVPVCEDPSTFDALNDHSEILSDSNDDGTSSDDNDFEDIEYVSLEEVNDVDQEVKEFDLEDILQIQDVILREKLLNVKRIITNIKSLNDNPTPDRVLKSPSSVLISVMDSNSFFEKVTDILFSFLG
ncbi:hypothetical protein Tco_1173706 [Tanacetum coccineum]